MEISNYTSIETARVEDIVPSFLYEGQEGESLSSSWSILPDLVP